MSIKERYLQFKAGLISLKEMHQFIDFENMGSDTTTWGLGLMTNKGYYLVKDSVVIAK